MKLFLVHLYQKKHGYISLFGFRDRHQSLLTTEVRSNNSPFMTLNCKPSFNCHHQLVFKYLQARFTFMLLRLDRIDNNLGLAPNHHLY